MPNGAPFELVIVCAGEAQGDGQENNDGFLENTEVLRLHPLYQPLTDAGRRQAKSAGSWIRENESNRIGLHLVSDENACLETAGLLGLPDALWQIESDLRAREWGELEALSSAERRRLIERFERDVWANEFFARPGNVESMAQVALRCSALLHLVVNQSHMRRAIIVCKVSVAWALRVLIEHLSSSEYSRIRHERHDKDVLHPGQILLYSRQEEGGRNDEYTRVCSVCPWNTDLSPNEWISIQRKFFSNEELLTRAQDPLRRPPLFPKKG
ncbi:MAG TPA: histidine phosphatase family protein [Patescibacteria group bacterium]|nr:histidine phosphatase family protein [Patescibacteria group bacterium]